MRIRLTGTPAEVDAAAALLRAALDVVDISDSYPCRPPSRLVRMDLDVRTSADEVGPR